MADLGGVRGVQMHPPLVASLSIDVVLHTLPAGSSIGRGLGTRLQQPELTYTLTFQFLTDFQTFE